MKEVDENDIKVIGINKLVLFCSSDDDVGIGVLLTDSCSDREIQVYIDIYNK